MYYVCTYVLCMYVMGAIAIGGEIVAEKRDHNGTNIASEPVGSSWPSHRLTVLWSWNLIRLPSNQPTRWRTRGPVDAKTFGRPPLVAG